MFLFFYYFMRLLFKKGKQKEMLKREKEELNLTWFKFAEHLNMKYGKLITFFNEERLIDEQTFNKLILKKDYKKFIIKRLNDYWGQSKGGINSKGRTKEIRIPDKNEGLAELWGIMLGDGHLQKIQGYKLGVYGIDIAGHSIDDKEYLVDFIKPLCEKLFAIDSRIYQSKRSNCIHVIVDSRRIVDFFELNGFKAGNKIANKLGIPNWIKENSNLLRACLRGLFDTDGSFYKLTNQNSYQINFCNKNQRLLEEVNKSLLGLGVEVSKIMEKRRMVITKKSEIKKFYKLIGFHNPKHLNKIKLLF